VPADRFLDRAADREQTVGAQDAEFFAERPGDRLPSSGKPSTQIRCGEPFCMDNMKQVRVKYCH
jgi:hypothetical protein